MGNPNPKKPQKSSGDKAPAAAACDPKSGDKCVAKSTGGKNDAKSVPAVETPSVANDKKGGSKNGKK